MCIQDLSAVALSTMPGMPLSLRVGLEYTKDMLLRHPHLPLIPIHHMEAHALTVRMIQRYVYGGMVFYFKTSAVGASPKAHIKSTH